MKFVLSTLKNAGKPEMEQKLSCDSRLLLLWDEFVSYITQLLLSAKIKEG